MTIVIMNGGVPSMQDSRFLQAYLSWTLYSLDLKVVCTREVEIFQEVSLEVRKMVQRLKAPAGPQTWI